MKLTIITVNLNNLEGLKRTVSSVLSQSWRDFEYFVIDGASTDGSAEYLESTSKDLSWWVSEKDQGLYDAMNKGIERAKGEYLLFLNSGDYLVNERVLEQAKRELTGEGIIYGDLLEKQRNGKLSVRKFPDVLDFGFLYSYYLPHPSTFIRRDIFNLTGNYVVNEISSDWQFLMKAIFEFRASYKHLKQSVAVYCLDGISSNPANLEIMAQEKRRYVSNNYPALSDSLLNTLENDQALVKNLGNSRIIRLIVSVGFLQYLKKYLDQRKLTQ